MQAGQVHTISHEGWVGEMGRRDGREDGGTQGGCRTKGLRPRAQHSPPPCAQGGLRRAGQ